MTARSSRTWSRTRSASTAWTRPAPIRGGVNGAHMGAMTEIKVPDIGDFKDVPVIEILVKPGDTVKAGQARFTLESDKATMDVPAPLGGTVQELRVKLGDKVSEGTVLMTVATGGPTTPPPSAPLAAPPAAPAAPASAATSSLSITT